MLNRVFDNKQCDNGYQSGGHRHAVQLGALRCWGASQIQPVFGMQSIV